MAMPLRVMVFGLAMLVVSGLMGCSTNPATGKRSFMLQSWEWERAMAAQAGPEFTNEYGGETPDAGVQAYVDEVGAKLTSVALEQAHAEVPELDWSYTLLDSAVLNAFALPGGKVYISRGLAEKLENEAQLAGVLGHEVGHVMARHGNQRISKQVGVNLLLTGAAVAVGVADEDSNFRQYGQYAVPALTVGGNVVMLSYGRDEELEADGLGIQYMVANGYDPAGQRQVMEILGRESGGSHPPEWLSTHPASETRVARINEMLKGEYAHTQNSPEYGLFPDPYKRRMLDRLASLPAPAQASARFDLADPVTWCAHCAGDAALASR
jgi:predicted Zn-dependent protease